jgi:hypothetical protein
METPCDNYELALSLADKGYIPVAMVSGTKVPAERGWQEWATRPVTRESIARRWKGTRHGVALLCHDLVVFDVDDGRKLDAVLARCGLTDAPICRTPGGGYHVHARARRGVALRRTIKVKGQDIDLLTGPSLSILPPHVGEDGKPYVWLTDGLPAKSELPLARVGWTRERTRRRSRAVVIEPGVLPAAQGSVRFPEAYCLKIPSVQGENGSRALVRCVCVLRDAGRSRQQALDFLLRVWNPACAKPEWSEREIRHAIDRHFPGRPRNPAGAPFAAGAAADRSLPQVQP